MNSDLRYLLCTYRVTVKVIESGRTILNIVIDIQENCGTRRYVYNIVFWCKKLYFEAQNGAKI